MNLHKGIASAVVVTTAAIIGFSAAAEARQSNYNPYCHTRMEGRATGQGLFGMGTANARSSAVSDWADKVNARWGIRYANFANARGVSWDCKKGAILQAKCVVTAMPCRR
ncbi:MAG: hypothetical protein R3D51_06755 [Hyphomicrobiaceae bacterium]